MPATKTILYIVLPAIVVTGVIIYFIKKESKKPDPNGPGANADATGPTAPIPKPAPISSNSSFPLRVGSRNDLVKQLQVALKVTADGIFGPVTEAALKSIAGVTIVKDQAELDAIIKKANTGTVDTSRAIELYNKFKAGGYAIQGTTTSTWTEVNEDAYGALHPTGMMITIYKGTTYSQAFKIVKTTKLGRLVIEVTSGEAKGLYTGDPATITLVKSA